MGAAIRNGQGGPGDENRGLLVPAAKVTASGMPGGSDPANVECEPIWLDRVTAADLMLIVGRRRAGPSTSGHQHHVHPDGFAGRHQYVHQHPRLVHRHPHVADIHHRHDHGA